MIDFENKEFQKELEQAFKEYEEARQKNLKTQKPHKFSKKFNHRIKKLISKTKYKKAYLFIKLLKVASILVIVGYVSLNVKAMAVNAYHFVMELQDNGETRVNFEDNNNENIDNEKFQIYAPTYIPNEYMLKKIDLFSNISCQYYYVNAKGESITYYQGNPENITTWLSEDAQTEEIIEKGNKYYYVDYEDYAGKTVMWLSDNYFFSIDVPDVLSKDTIMKMATSLSKATIQPVGYILNDLPLGYSKLGETLVVNDYYEVQYGSPYNDKELYFRRYDLELNEEMLKSIQINSLRININGQTYYYGFVPRYDAYGIIQFSKQYGLYWIDGNYILNLYGIEEWNSLIEIAKKIF